MDKVEIELDIEDIATLIQSYNEKADSIPTTVDNIKTCRGKTYKEVRRDYRNKAIFFENVMYENWGK